MLRTPALIFVFFCGLLPSLMPGKDYSIQSWRTGFGLEAHGIACCLVSKNGTVWIGGKGDLIRFDGIEFNRVSFNLPSSFSGNRITAIWEDDQQGVWCGYETGEVVAYDQRTRQATLPPVKWGRIAVRAIHGAPDGQRWIILDDHSLVRISDGWTSGSRNLGSGLRFFETLSGALFAEYSGSVYRWQPDGTWKQAFQNLNYINSAFASHREGVWLVDLNREKAFRASEDGTLLETRTIPQRLSTSKILETYSGKLMLAADRYGLSSIDAGDAIVSYGKNDGLCSEWIQQMSEDSNGNLVAVAAEGVSILRMSQAKSVARIDEFSGARILSVTGGQEGDIWIGTEGSGLFRHRNGILQQFDREAGIQNPNIWTILSSGPDQVQLGSWGGGLQTGNDGKFRKDESEGFFSRWVVTALLRSRDDSIWAGTIEGIGKNTDGAWKWFTRGESKPLGNVGFLAQGPGNSIWFAAEGQGAGIVDGDSVRLLDPDLVTGSQFVTALLGDGRDGLWIGTEGNGLFHWKPGKWNRIRQEDGLPSNDVFHIDDDGHGNLWFTSPKGVYSLRKEHLEKVVQGTEKRVSPLTINSEDGLPSNYCTGGTNNAAFLDSNGLYYVPTTGGLSVIDTNKVGNEANLLYPAFTRVTIDGQAMAIPADGRFTADPKTQSLKLEFAAPTLAHPELVEYSYRINGYNDDDWIPLGQSRNLSLQRLPPGNHQIEIRATNPGSSKVGLAAKLEIEQLPTITETLWFRGGLGATASALLTLLIWILVRRPYVREQRRLELETAVEKERRRIARDIHDDLGAHLAQVMILSQRSGELTEPNARTQLLGKIYAKAKQITKALDELVWTVNPSQDTVEGFASYVARISQELISAAGIRCRLRFPEDTLPITLNSGARHHLIMCAKEAIANAIKHARCTEIEVRIEIDRNRLRLTVSDDGCGFEIPREDDPLLESSDHSGCNNMRSRMRELNGRVTFESLIGKGSQVCFEYSLWTI